MKKIGILTFNNSYNYGALLQAYATQKFLNDAGNDVKFINYQNEYEYKNNKLFSYRKNLSLKRNMIVFLKNTMFFSFYYCNKSFKRFIKKMPTTRKYKKNELNQMEHFDIIISGSDQIWNPNIYGGEIDTTFLLDFNTNAQKMSYASSLGSYSIDKENEKIYYGCLKKFDYISVREDFAVNELRKIGLENVKKVCDPTMLISGSKWKEIINKSYKKVTNEKYAVVYLMSQYEEYAEQINKIAKFYGLKIVLVTFSNIKRKFVDYYAKSYDPLEFLNLLNDAEIILTNSFHGTVFSLLFNKEFFNLENVKNPQRVKSLLEQVNLSERIIKKDNKIEEYLNNIERINYSKVNCKLNEFSLDSQEWLLKCIGGD